MPDTRHLLEDPRLRIRIEDGRKALEADATLYDLIETDATWPETSGSGNLYSVEFFEAAKRRLKPGGVMCTWAPTARVGATFRAVFEHVLETPGGRHPHRQPRSDRLRSRGVGGAGSARRRVPRRGTCGRGGGGDRDAAAGRPAAAAIAPNRDLWPRDEYAVK